MDIEKLKIALEGEPKYRFDQAYKAIFVDLIKDWNECTTFKKELREKLNEFCPLQIHSEVAESEKSKAIKALITLTDNAKIETVLMLHADGRATVCVSSQVGCPLKCQFCATGKLGWKRDLTVGEIIEQILFFSRYIKEKGNEKIRITNVVFMGMGEPFLNYDNVMEAVRLINDKKAFNIGARSISISTSGVIPGIKKFTKEPLQINLAISLHAPNNELRSKLMPVNKAYPLKEVLRAVEEYVDKKGRQVMFEYVMIDGVNDSLKEARELAEIMNNYLYVVNLIRYNPTGGFRPSTAASVRRFKNELLRSGVKVTERHAFGQDIDAACGQLAARKDCKK